MSKREFLLLAQEYESKHDISGWWLSEKLDGQRCFWDGSLSRGLPATEVPYCNTAKDARYKVPPISTGLFSRYGKVIHAPAWFLDQLPLGTTLDAELWSGNGTFQSMRSTVGSLDGGEGWKLVKAWAIDSPSWLAVLQDGELTGPNWRGYLDRSMLGWVEARTRVLAEKAPLSGSVHAGFGQPDECFKKLRELWGKNPSTSWEPMRQEKLPRDLDEARRVVAERLHELTSAGGEGLILRSSTSPWVPKRVNWVLKVKKLSDAEGTVTGMTWGRETALGSRHLGRMGALILELAPGVPTGAPMTVRRLELSGFTDVEREVKLREENNLDLGSDYIHVQVGGPEDEDGNLTTVRKLVPVESVAQAGKDASKRFEPAHFPIGSKVTFTYRELTNDGLPKEARFLRRRHSE